MRRPRTAAAGGAPAIRGSCACHERWPHEIPHCSVGYPTDADPPSLPSAPPAGEAPSSARLQGARSQAERLDVLRAMVAAVAAAGVARPDEAGAPARKPIWSLGADAADAVLGPLGLAVDGVHEVKPALTAVMPAAGGATGGAATGGITAADRAAALFFALCLARRRLVGRADIAVPAILWCEPRHEMRELGRLHAPGLAALGIDPRRLILVETRHPDEALWVLEEGLRSGGLALAVALVDDVALTPARRLALAAERFRTPCLLLTGARAPPAAATATRWRIGRAASAPHDFDARAPGASRLAVSFERCRGQPLAAERAFTLEWSHEAYRFHMAAGVADRAHAPGRAAEVEPGAGRIGLDLGHGSFGRAFTRSRSRAAG